MSGSDTTERHAIVEAPLPLVHGLLCAPNELVALHPLITAVRLTGDEEDNGSHVVSFDIEERIPLGPFHWPNRYSGEIRTWPGDLARVSMVGRSFPNVVVETEVRLETIGEGRTQLHQSTRVSAPWFIRKFVRRVAKAAHDKTFAETKQVAEARARAPGRTGTGPDAIREGA